MFHSLLSKSAPFWFTTTFRGRSSKPSLVFLSSFSNKMTVTTISTNTVTKVFFSTWENNDNNNEKDDDILMTIGIARETYNPWERRAPLTPPQVKTILLENDNKIAFAVQSSARRTFSDLEYEQAGATIIHNDNDLSMTDIIMSVKRPDTVLPDKTYLCFSHTIKGQTENMKLLYECLQKNVQLIDYERITETNNTNNINDSSNITKKKNKRLVSFGRYAGIAGAIDTLHGLGRTMLLNKSISTPFLSFPPAILHYDLHEAKQSINRIAERIVTEGIHFHEPIVITITGKGGCVHNGVMEIIQLLPHEIIPVSKLPELFSQQQESLMTSNSNRQYKIYIVQVDIDDAYQRKNGENNNNNNFNRQHFKQYPSEYRSQFATTVAPYTHVIINCAYWDARYPRLLTKRQMKRIWERGNQRLHLVSDISCDVNGSIEFLERTTSIEKPFFQYDPITESEIHDNDSNNNNNKNSITILGVDILPTELPRESSDHFGNSLKGVVDELIQARIQQKVGTKGFDQNLLRPGLADAFITTSDGSLTKGYQYLRTLMDLSYKKHISAKGTMTLALEGHLFDSGLINQILDVIEQSKSGVEFQECFFPLYSGMSTTKSSVVLKIVCDDEKTLAKVEQKIKALVDIIEKADASLVRLDDKSANLDGSSSVEVESTIPEKRVLLLGAGRVSKSCVDYLGRSQNIVVKVASEKEDEARDAASASEKAQYVTLDVVGDKQRLSELVKDSDLVISLLPAPMHPPIAMECISQNKHLVTASYESKEMRELAELAKEANVIILNEVGLDPGLDHMSAMKIIDGIKARGGQVNKFLSVCGGLPHPDAANNPLKYKFSWSPMGVIRASLNSARYRSEGNIRLVEGQNLLSSATPFLDSWQNLELDCLPNRDSIGYEQVYGIGGVETLFRGTLRYGGFCNLMNTFKNMGFFESTKTDANTWNDLVNELRCSRSDASKIAEFVLECAGGNANEADKALKTLEWLDILGQNKVDNSVSVVENFCRVLENRLVYEEGENDMVLMHHTIEASFEDGRVEKHYSSLQVFGDESMSAMAKTVGFTAAASAELLLDGTLKNESGLLLPTNPKVYLPVLENLELDGIIFDENVVESNEGKMQQEVI